MWFSKLNKIFPIFSTSYEDEIRNAAKNKNKTPATTGTSVEKNYFHKLTFEELKKRLNTDLTNGLHTAAVKSLLGKDGPNVIEAAGSAMKFKLLQNFFSRLMIIFWVGFLLNILLFRPLTNDPNDFSSLTQAVAILFIIIVSGSATSYQDYATFAIMKSFSNLHTSKATVMRDGQKVKIAPTELVVGDIIFLKNEHRVPADCRIIESKNMRLDKSMLTGESDPVNCTADQVPSNNPASYLEATNIAFMTTLVIAGCGKAVVVSTGPNTLISSISKLTSLKSSQKLTMIQRELNRFANMIILLSVITIIVMAIIWGAWLRTISDIYGYKYLLILISSYLISYMPFGFPAAIALTLILSSRKMKHNNILIKNVNAVETLGAVNVIASDKTGTLTQNKMTVAGLTCGMQEVDREACFCESPVYIGDMTGIRQLLACSYLCNNAKVNRDVKRGNATDIALYKFSQTNMNVKDLNGVYKFLFEIKFNSRNKYHITIIEPKNKEKHEELFGKDLVNREMIVKGAYDILIKKCKYTLMSDGSMREIDAEEIDKLTKLQDYWCSIGRRCILICKRKLDDFELRNKLGTLETYFGETVNDLCIMGLVSLIDPPKEGMRDVILKCRQAGIRIMMITGDFSITAESISAQVGLYSPLRELDTLKTMKWKDVYRHKDKFMSLKSSLQDSTDNLKKVKFEGAISLSGKDIDLMKRDEWNVICNYYDEIIISRTTPIHKLKVIKEFQSHGYIIGMTGDGLNDAPALKCADIGIAMGNGNEVAIEASHVVLLDNSFAYIAQAIENGRLVFDNLKKVFLFLLPAGVISQVAASVSTTILGLPPVLSPYQMIIIGIVTDLIPALALVFERGETDLMSRPPRSENEHLVSYKLLLHALLFPGLYMVIISHFAYFLNLNIRGGFMPGDVLFVFNDWTAGFYGYTQSQIDDFNGLGQCSAYLAIVLTQSFGHLYCVRTRYLSLFYSFPTRKRFRNLWLFPASIIVLLISVFLIYSPFIQQIIGTRPSKYWPWLLGLAFGLGFIILDELRKFLIRKGIYNKKYAL